MASLMILLLSSREFHLVSQFISLFMRLMVCFRIQLCTSVVWRSVEFDAETTSYLILCVFSWLNYSCTLTDEPDNDDKFDFAAEMEIDMQENILETKSMDSESIILLMVIVTRVHGMKAGSRDMASILFEMATQDVVCGMVVPLSTLLRR